MRETRDHLFFGCPYSKRIRSIICRKNGDMGLTAEWNELVIKLVVSGEEKSYKTH